MKRKLNEATNLTTFNEAVKLAKRLEKIDEILTDEYEVSSILKQSTTFPNQRSKNNYRSTFNDRRDRSNNRRDGSNDRFYDRFNRST